MGLFDYFTNDAQKEAAQSQIAGINAGLNQYNSFAGQGRGALQGNYDQGINALINNYSAAQGSQGQGVGALQGNYGTAAQSLTGNYGAGISALGQGYGNAVNAYQPLVQGANAGAAQYGNALGLNGPQGNAQATQAFWNNPGIQAQLDIGSENVMRKAAATGGPASGSTLTALQDYGQQVASQGWGNYVNQLQPYLNQQTNAAAGLGNLYSGYGNAAAGQYANLGNQQAGLYTGLGNQLAGQYNNIANTQMQQGNQLAGQYANLGTQLNQSYTNQGQAGYGAQTSIGNANANADLAAATASGNIWNTAIGAAGALAGSPSGLFKTAGQLGSGIANTFGGGQQGGGGVGSGYNPTGGFNWSDERIKDGIEKLTELADGTNVYRFRYKGDPSGRTHIGLMAQEVEKTNPDAVIEIGGIKAVDYGRATDFAAKLMKLAA